jgi:hypothetical protein
MNGINRKLRGLALAALAAAAFLSQAEAAPVVSVSPATQTIGVGDPATVNIIVSGLTQALGGFSFILGFNNAILSSTGYTPNPDNLMGVFPLDLSLGFTGGSLDVFYIADEFATEADLAAGQGASFTLATVGFKGLTEGLSPLTLTGVALSNFTGGATIAGVGVQNGEICVNNAGARCAAEIPEPTTMLLVATALGTLAWRRRKAA